MSEFVERNEKEAASQKPKLINIEGNGARIIEVRRANISPMNED